MTRIGLIALCLIALSVPPAAVCEAMAEAMSSCAMPSGHESSACVEEIGPSAGCCDPGAVDVATDLILKRPDELLDSAVASVFDGDANSLARDLGGRRVPDPEPPPGVAPYRLFSALLL